MWQAEPRAVGVFGWDMAHCATICHRRLAYMAVYVTLGSARARYTRIRPYMHHPLFILWTHRQKCVHKIDT